MAETIDEDGSIKGSQHYLDIVRPPVADAEAYYPISVNIRTIVKIVTSV